MAQDVYFSPSKATEEARISLGIGQANACFARPPNVLQPAWATSVNAADPTSQTSADWKAQALAQDTQVLNAPGVGRAIARTAGADMYQRLVKATLSQDMAAAAAALIRDMDHDPKALNMEIPAEPRGHGYEARRQQENIRMSMWGMINRQLYKGADDLAAEDWMSLFRVTAKHLRDIDGERNKGFEVAARAVWRADVFAQAVGEFPTLFRSARDKAGNHTILSTLALLTEKAPHTQQQIERSIELLRGTKLLEKAEDLMLVPLSANQHVKQAFLSAFGAQAIVNAKDSKGLSPLHIIIHQRTAEEAIGWLIEHGADPMARCDSKQTPLNRAVLGKTRVEVVSKLLDHGNYPADHLSSVLQDNSWNALPETVALLQSHLAKRQVSMAIAQARMVTPSTPC